MTAIRTAVILAAGMGTRLKGFTVDQPKGFLQIDGKSLIVRSINNLVNHGITNIVIGTGYFHEHFDQLRTMHSGISTFRNEDFATTGSMYTLYVLRELVTEPFLLLESDLLYDPMALDYLLLDMADDLILASGPTQSGDEVFIQYSSDGYLQNMSKDKSVLQHISGELVGISKLSLPALDNMVAYAEPFYKQGSLKMNYEDAMVGASTHYNFGVKLVDDLVWCEIDDEQHLQRALRQVYPKILGKSTHTDKRIR
jgi:2-aminoethylphosphonate-pyruvate transaminase